MKVWKLLTALIVLLLTVTALAQAPERVELDIHELVLDLAGENPTAVLTAAVFPEGAENNLKWYVSDDKVLSCENGQLTALRRGKAVVTVRPHGYGNIKDSCSVTVIDSRIPERIAAYPSSISLEPFQTRQIECISLPGTSSCEYLYKSGNNRIVTVDETGLVTAVGQGSSRVTVVSALDPNVSVTIPVTVQYGKRITDLSFPNAVITMERGETAYCGLVREPADSSNAILYVSSDEDVVRVDEDGTLTALRHGKAQITATSHRNLAVTASMWVMVTDSLYPTKINCTPEEPPVLGIGDSVTLSVSMEPAGCDDRYYISSSHGDIVSVKGDTITGLKRGMSVISVFSVYNDELVKDIPVVVEDGEVVLRMPLRRTDEAGIADNVACIRAVRECAFKELDALNDAGVLIKEKEYERRREIIENAFTMYDFVWTVNEVQKYWSPANSEGGAKDFKPGTFYYGLPYTSGSNYNHTYSVEKALEEERYVPVEGKEYYLLKKSPYASATAYAGNDCSAFVALCMWEHTVYAGNPVKTGTLYYDYRLVHFEDPMELRPGDILVRHSVHVVMFLYWADEEHTQAVFIQQGGSEPGINTVNTVVQDISYYTDDYYRLRRIRNFTED